MASSEIIVLTEESFDREVSAPGTPILVDFWAEWCGPCKMLAPVLDELATEMAGKIRIAKVDVDTNQQLAGRFNVTSIPTLLLFKGGQVMNQMRGARSKRDLKASLDQALA